MPLHALAKPQKLLLTSFLLLLTVGYAVGLLFVELQTSMRPDGIQKQFLGAPEGGDGAELAFEKSPREMLVFLHNHLLGLSLIFLAVGGILSMAAGVHDRLKTLLIVEPFVAILTTFGGIALTRFVSPAWSWLVMISRFLNLRGERVTIEEDRSKGRDNDGSNAGHRSPGHRRAARVL